MGFISWGILNFRMATAVFHQALGAAQSHQHLQNSGSHYELVNASVKLIGFKVDSGLPRRGSCSSCKRKFGVLQESSLSFSNLSGSTSFISPKSQHWWVAKEISVLVSFWKLLLGLERVGKEACNDESNFL